MIPWWSENGGPAVTRLTTTQARDAFSALLKRVATGGERVILHRRGEDLAALIPMEDLRLLERLVAQEEDRLDVEDARRVLADPNEAPISWDQMKAELGLGS